MAHDVVALVNQLLFGKTTYIKEVFIDVSNYTFGVGSRQNIEIIRICNNLLT